MHSDQSHINLLPLGKQSWAAANDKWVYEGDNLAIKIYTAINICWADFIAEKQTESEKPVSQTKYKGKKLSWFVILWKESNIFL